jgi:aldehyde:ferredoxin oxidoreductase
MTGPIVGTQSPSAGRCEVCALSPLTGIWGESNTGGFIGPELRFSGYDGVIITGQSSSPTWLSIFDGKAELRDASGLWGSDLYKTQSKIHKELDDSRVKVASIGVAGENLVKMAAVMNDHGRAAGRTGMGAVMGSKRLKAIAFRGSSKPPVSDPDSLGRVIKNLLKFIREDITTQIFSLGGTAVGVDGMLLYGDMPIRYYQQGEWEEARDLSGALMAERYLNRGDACYRCPVACGRETRAPRFGVDKVHGPEYETLGALGSLAMINDLEGVIYAGHLCNLYGLDTIGTGCAIALAYEMFERGIIDRSDTDGLELRYGDIDLTLHLIELIAKREGLGDELAEGSAAFAEQHGVPELAVAVNGLDVPMHDPRAFSGLAAIYALSPRGACHMQGDMYGVGMGQSLVPEVGIGLRDRFDSSEEQGRVSARVQAWRNLYNSMILCQFVNPGAKQIAALVNSVTGWDLTVDDLITVGKRIVTIKRLLNLRLGITRDDERMPELLRTSLTKGGTEGNVPNLDTLLAGAYAEYGWDLDSGSPKPETLELLGIEGVVEK